MGAVLSTEANVLFQHARFWHDSPSPYECQPTMSWFCGSLGLLATHPETSEPQLLPVTMIGLVAPVFLMAVTISCMPATTNVPSPGCDPVTTQPPLSQQLQLMSWGSL